MARDADGRPQPAYNTKGRRSVSQRSRDFAEKLRAAGAMFEGSPKLLEAVMGGTFIGAFIWLLRPVIVVTENPTSRTMFRGKRIGSIDIIHPDEPYAEYVAILVGISAAHGSGDIGSIFVPAGAGLVFRDFIRFIWKPEVATNETSPYTNPGYNPHTTGPDIDITVDFYLKEILPRYIRALFVAAFFYIMLRYLRHAGA